jgi:hypothetical protein
MLICKRCSIYGSAAVRIAPISIVITIAKGSPPFVFGIEKSLHDNKDFINSIYA